MTTTHDSPPPSPSPPIPTPSANPRNQVVMVIHGIRDYGSWQTEIEAAISSKNVVVVPTRYGFFDTLRFLDPFDDRTRIVDRIVGELRNIKKNYPGYAISVIAHSFGTYLLLNALMRDRSLRLWRLILCGAVIDHEFDWNQIAEQIGCQTEQDAPRIPMKNYILNDCGNADQWPMLACAIGWQYGHSGTYGFGTTLVTDRVHQGGHGVFLTKQFAIAYWLPFIKSGNINPGTGELASKIAWRYRLAAQWYTRLTLFVPIAVLGWIRRNLLNIVAAILLATSWSVADRFLWQPERALTAAIERLRCQRAIVKREWVPADSDTLKIDVIGREMQVPLGPALAAVLSAAGGCADLVTLNLIRCRTLATLDELHSDRISSLLLDDVGVKSLSGVNGMRSLREIVIRNCEDLETLDGCSGLLQLEALQIENCPNVENTLDRDFVRRLKTLNVVNCPQWTE